MAAIYNMATVVNMAMITLRDAGGQAAHVTRQDTLSLTN